MHKKPLLSYPMPYETAKLSNDALICLPFAAQNEVRWSQNFFPFILLLGVREDLAAGPFLVDNTLKDCPEFCPFPKEEKFSGKRTRPETL